jgi:glycosyltransferase involved in cell wall biosynthesis
LKKNRIAIIELETHAFLLDQWYALLIEMESTAFHFFVHPKISEKITGIPKDLVTLVNNPSDVNIYIESYDTIIINTFHRNFKQYAPIFVTKPVLCLIHNLNFSLLFSSINFKNFLIEKHSFKYYLKLYFLEKIATHRKNILHASNYGVLSENIFQELKTKNASIAQKTTVVSLYYAPKISIEFANTIQIVMPGNVSEKRKDLALVFDVLPKLNPKTKLHFIFLGKPENTSILNKLENLKASCSSNVSVTYYKGFIPWEEYQSVITKSHLLFCPIKVNTSFYWVNEVYGKTKLSGSEIDCIQNGKVAIFPSTYPKMDWHNLYYKNELDLLQMLNSLTFDSLQLEYKALQPYLENYSFEKIKTKLENYLLTLASK